MVETFVFWFKNFKFGTCPDIVMLCHKYSIHIFNMLKASIHFCTTVFSLKSKEQDLTLWVSKDPSFFYVSIFILLFRAHFLFFSRTVSARHHNTRSSFKHYLCYTFRLHLYFTIHFIRDFIVVTVNSDNIQDIYSVTFSRTLRRSFRIFSTLSVFRTQPVPHW